MTKRENEMRERIYSVEEQLVRAAIMITEARERAEAAEKERDDLIERLNNLDAWQRKLVARAETAEKQLGETKAWAGYLEARVETAEKRVKELEQGGKP